MKVMYTRAVCALGIGVGLLAASPASVRAQNPTAQPLLQAGDMRYLGSVPVARTDGRGNSLTYGGGALGVNPQTQTLFVARTNHHLCEVSIPSAPGQLAPVVQPCTDVTEGRRAQIDVDGGNLGGSMVWNGRLIVSAFSYYDADGSAHLSHFASGLNFGQSGDVLGPFQVGTAGAGFVAGYMSVIPPEWRGLLGGPALTGQCCISIISRSSSGPSVSVFNPDDVGRVSPVPATPLLGYPLSMPLAGVSSQNALFNLTTSIKGVAFPAGTRSVLFIGRQGLGPYCYGTAGECGGDPVQIYKGPHAYPYVHQVWAYDANDLLAVKRGQRSPASVQPYATWQLPEMGRPGAATILGAAYDHTTGRLYITENYGENPRVHAYHIGRGSGGGALPTPSAPQGLTGSVEGPVVSLRWSPSPSAGLAGYVVEAGSAAGASNIVRVPVGPMTTTLMTQAPPGRYFVRVRAFNAQSVPGGASNEVTLQVDGPASVAGQPQDLHVSVAGSSVRLAWNPPASGGAASEHLLDAGTAAGASNIINGLPIGPGFTLTVPNVPPGTYFVRVRGKNAIGVSEPSNEARFAVAAPTVPLAPSGLRALVSADRTVTLAWTAPQSGGAPAGFVIEAGSVQGGRDIATSQVGLTTTVGVPRVPPGTYYVRVRSRNTTGIGPPTADVRVVVP